MVSPTNGARRDAPPGRLYISWEKYGLVLNIHIALKTPSLSLTIIPILQKVSVIGHLCIASGHFLSVFQTCLYVTL